MTTSRRLLPALLTLLGIFLAAFAVAASARADGFIIIPRPVHGSPPLPPGHYPFAPLEVASHRVAVKIEGQIAVTTVEQEFVNPNNAALEGTYIFPVPRGAHIDKFTMEINGRQAEAELLPADKARGIYEDIVRQMKDPALLEYAGRDVFKVRIYPIEPRSRKQVRISYSELLRADNGTLTYLYPLATEKFSARAISQVSVKVSLGADAPLGAIYSPSHPVEIRREREGNGRRATVGWEARDVRPDTDFQLVFAPEKSAVGLRVLSFRDPDAGPRGGADEQGWFLLLAAPSPESREGEKPSAKDVVFVVDTSGSMAGPKMNQAKKALDYCVASLQPEDRFEIVRFSTEAEGLFGRLAAAGDAERKRAATFIKDLRAAGGTAIADALKAALKLRAGAGGDGDRPFVVVFLTDGQPTVGPTSEDAILDVVRKAGDAAKNTRVFCFGIGNDVNTHLLDQLAETTRAASQYVLPEEDIEVKVSSFFARVREPALTNLRLEFGDGVRVSQLLPGELPDLFRGDQLVAVGRYRGAGEADVTLTGRAGGREQRFVYRARFGSGAADDPGVNGSENSATREFIPRLWATRRVGFLLDEIRLRGETAEVKDEVVALARKFGIVTPYTAYLILDDEERRRVPAPRRSLSQMDKDSAAKESARGAYDDFRNNKAGESAVANAQSQASLRKAEQATGGIASSNTRALDASRSVAAAPASRGRSGGPLLATPPPPAEAAAAQNRLAGYTQNSRFVNGRAFYQNGRQWVDGGLQSTGSSVGRSPVRVQFGSAEYFTLLKDHPEAAGWLALGQNVLLALGDTAYEIYE